MTSGQIGLTADVSRSGRRIRTTFLSAFVLASLLSACAFDPPTIQRTPREVSNADKTAKGRQAARKGASTKAAPAEQPAADGNDITVPGDDTAALEVDLTNFKERLIGLDSDEVNDLLGTPNLERAEAPALIWQYRHASCTVDIFMFDDGIGATVDHVEVRPANPSIDDKACFTALLRNPKSSTVRNGQQPISPAAPSGAVEHGVPIPPPGGAGDFGDVLPPEGKDLELFNMDSPPPGAAPAPKAPAAAPPAKASAAPSPSAPSSAKAPAAPVGDDEGPTAKDMDIDFDMGTPPAKAPAAAVPPAPRAAPAPAPKTTAAPPPKPAPKVEVAPPPAAPAPVLPDPVLEESRPPAAAPAPGAAPSSSSMDPPTDVEAAPPISAAVPPPPAPPEAKTAPAAPRAPSPVPPVAKAAPAPPAAAKTPVPKRLAGGEKPAETVDDEDLPPDLLRNGRGDDDPAYNNQDMVE